MKTLKTLILFCALAFASLVHGAASTTINLSTYPKAITANGKKTLAELFTVAEAKSVMPDAFRAMATMRGWTDTQTMALALFNAIYTDAVCRGALINQGSPGSWRVISRNTVVCDLYGAWWINDNVNYAYGTYTFPNAGPGNADYAGDLGGFEIVHWHENWKGPASNRSNGDRVLFGAYHGGSDVLVDYSEGTFITGALRVDGRAGDYLSTTRPRIVGAEWWDMGEASSCPAIFAHHCDIGQRYARGTPANAPFTQSCFSNTVAGTEVNGAANIHIAMLSGDDSPVLLRSVPGYSRPATFNARIDCIKAEWAITPSALRLWKPQHIMELEGQFKVSVGLLTYAATNARTESMFRVKPSLSDSYLRVDVLDVFNKQGPDYFVHDLQNGKAWPFNPNVTGFEYFSYGNGTLVSWPYQVQPVALPAAPRKGYVTAGSAFPSWSDVTGNGGTAPPVVVPPPVVIPPVAPPTTPLVLAWATTFAGTNVRTMVATTGASVTVDAAWKGFATIANGTATTQTNTQFPIAIPMVRRVVLKGATFTAPVRDYAVINSGLKVRTDGTVTLFDGATPVGRFTPGVKGDVVLDYPAPVDLTTILGVANLPCALFSCDAMEVWK
jgi:hypothetical protein